VGGLLLVVLGVYGLLLTKKSILRENT